jgi:probable F420-dependent oxidoreductase
VRRPFRFGLQAARLTDPQQWVDLARTAERSGYATLMVPDHLGRLGTFPALMSAAAVTSQIKLATYVLNQDFRPPAILAQDAASMQVLTGGRLELGIGAGWARTEYLRAGLTYDPASVRVARLGEYVQLVKCLLQATTPVTFAGQFFRTEGFQPLPGNANPPPILIGGGSPKILAMAGRLADIISVSTRASADGRVDMPNIRLSAVEDKVRFIREAAPERFAQIELNMTIRELRLTNDRRSTARELLNEWARLPERHANLDQLSEDDVLDSPHMALGTVDQIVAQLVAARDRWGFAYIQVGSTDAAAVAPILERLGGR